jgi:hypothetical protein
MMGAPPLTDNQMFFLHMQQQWQQQQQQQQQWQQAFLLQVMNSNQGAAGGAQGLVGNAQGAVSQANLQAHAKTTAESQEQSRLNAAFEHAKLSYQEVLEGTAATLAAMFKMRDTRVIVTMFASGHTFDPLAFLALLDEDGRKFICTAEALPQYELYAKHCLIPVRLGHVLPITIKIQIVGHPEVERIRSSKPEALAFLAKAVSKVMFEATGYDPTKPCTLSDSMLLIALNGMKLIAVNMAAEVKLLLQEQHKADPSNEEAKALIARADPLYRVLLYASQEIEHLSGVASFLVASAPNLSAKLTAKIRLELLVVAKKLRTRLQTGRAGNWPIPRSIDPHALSLSADVDDLRRLIREGFDEMNRKTVAAAPTRKQASTADDDDQSDDETPQQAQKRSKASAASSRPPAASSGAASSSSRSSNKIARDLGKQPLDQLASMRAAGGGNFKTVMFDLCPSVITKDVECKMAGKSQPCRFWHLCAACIKNDVDPAICLSRRHCDHPTHK